MRWGILENKTPMPMGVPLHLQVGTIAIYYWGGGGVRSPFFFFFFGGGKFLV